ncbi:MAG: hypothetical protein CMN30_33270 [Sandaracinus sp.]|nr:hypothetical protein [Sandaracinus sp.]
MSPQQTERGDDYVELTPLASGGMGTVSIVLRREGGFERVYARKTLRAGFESDGDVRRMFLTEGKIAGLLRHRNVVSVIDVREGPTGPYLIMEYIDGASLAEILRELGGRGQRLPLAAALEIVADAARGLHAAHRATTPAGERLTVVHRDVSPHNLLIGFDGVTRVTDFGVAKVLEHLSTTTEGLLKGKLGYMSPEQLRFQDLDPRSDLFSLGVVLYEVLAGKRLYGKGSTPPPRRILEEPPPDIGEERSDLPPAVEQLLFRILAKEREHRPATALEVAEVLDEVRGELDAEDLPELLETLFGEQRVERAERIAEAVRAMRDSSALPAPEVELTVDLDDATRAAVPRAIAPAPTPAPTPTPTPTRSRRSLLLAGAVGTAALVAVGLGLATSAPEVPEATEATEGPRPPTGFGPDAGATESATASESAVEPEPAAPVALEEADVETPVDVEALPLEGTVVEAGSMEPTPMEAAPREPASAPTRRARRRRAAPAAAEPAPTAMTRAAPADDIWTSFPR